MSYNPKRRMAIGYAVPLILAWFFTFEVSWFNLLVAIWTWLGIALHVVYTPMFFAWARSGKLPSSILTEKNKLIATQVPFYMYVIGFVCASVWYGVLYQYYPITAAVAWVCYIVFLASFTYLMETIRDNVKLKG